MSSIFVFFPPPSLGGRGGCGFCSRFSLDVVGGGGLFLDRLVVLGFGEVYNSTLESKKRKISDQQRSGSVPLGNEKKRGCGGKTHQTSRG